MVKKKENFRRSKLKEERLRRLKYRHKASQKKRENDELFKMITLDSIDTLSNAEKNEILSQLKQLLISFPESNSDKLSLLLLFMKDNSIKIISKAVETLSEVFTEILPSYRIVEINSKQRESKEVEKLKAYEKNLSEKYLEFVTNIEILDRNFYKNKECDAVREKFCKSIGDLFEKFFYFNHEEKLYKYLIEKLCDDLESIKQKAFLSLYNVLGRIDNSKTMFELKLSITKRIANAILYKDNSRFDKNVLDLFTAHRIEFPDLTQEEKNKIDLSDLKFGGNEKGKDSKKTKRELKEFNKEKAKIVKSMQKEMNEIEQKDDMRMIYHMNLKIIKQILLVFFTILKSKNFSPLICGVFNGISKLCENINVEILLDLQKNIYNVIQKIISEKNNLSAALLGLKANYTIAVKLTKEIVSLHDSFLTNSCYEILCYLESPSIDDMSIIFEVVEMIFLKSREFSKEIGGAYVKRLALFAKKEKRENFVVAVLLLIKRILAKYSDFGFLIDNDDEGDLFKEKITTSPEFVNGHLTNIVKELKEIEGKFSKSKMVKKVVNYILTAQKTNIELSSLNYYEILHKS